jgi:hypothetical protein
MSGLGSWVGVLEVLLESVRFKPVLKCVGS